MIYIFVSRRKVYAVFIEIEIHVQRKIRTHLDLLSTPQLGGKKCQNV